MKPTSKELLSAISKLNKLNLNAQTPYCALATVTLGDSKHSDDDKILQLISAINKRLALSEEENAEYKASPIGFMGSATLVGIHNNQKETYRIIRAENFKANSLFCKNIEHIGFNLYIIQDNYLDVLFV